MTNTETNLQKSNTENESLDTFESQLFIGFGASAKTHLSKIKEQIYKKIKSFANEYDYVVLTTRRCFCICEAMTEEYGADFFASEKIISSQKIDIVGNKFKDKNIILIDDVMIHGTAVLSLYEKLLNKYMAANIDTFVFVRNIEFPDYYEFKTKKKHESLFYNNTWEWRQISNECISYIHSKKKLYISYLYGYIVDSKQLLNCIFELSANNKIKEITRGFEDIMKHRPFEDDNAPQYYIYYQNYNFIKNAALRVYDFGDDKKQLIPYVELKDFYADDLDDIWKSVWINEVIPDPMKVIITSEDKFKALTCVVSLFFYHNLFYSNKKIEETPTQITDYIDKSYFDNFIEVIKTNIKTDAIQIISNIYKEPNLNTDYNQIPDTIMKECLPSLESLNKIDVDDYKSIKQCVLNYIYQVTNEEEKYFYEKIAEGINEQGFLTKDNISESYTLPIFTTLIYNKIPENIFEDAYAILLFLLDFGVLSHVVKKIGNIVGTCEKTGEQSYHLFSDLLGNAFKGLYFLLSNINNLPLYMRDDFTNKFMDKLETYDDGVLKDYKSLIIQFVKNQPLNFRADYFGIEKLRNRMLTKDDERQENAIIEEIAKLINAV